MDAILIETEAVPSGDRMAQGYNVGGLIFLSSQSAAEVDGSIAGAGDFDAQVTRIMEKIDALLLVAGSDRSKIVKVNLYLRGGDTFKRLIPLREKWFFAPYPADTVVEVKRLPHPDALIAIEVIAVAGEGRLAG